MLRAALASRSAVYEQFSSAHTYTRDPTQMKMNYVSMMMKMIITWWGWEHDATGYYDDDNFNNDNDNNDDDNAMTMPLMMRIKWCDLQYL